MTTSNRNLQFPTFATVLSVVFLQALRAASLLVPTSNCYAIDNSSHIHDFSDWFGHPFVYEDKESDIVVRFCKDVESRSQKGYQDFGRFDNFNRLLATSGPNAFVKEFYGGDLVNCEQSYDKMGRSSQVNIKCGSCPSATCKGELGCICNVSYESSCRVLVELAIPCDKPGPRVFEGFTVGFHPRTWEIVYNGMTQLGFENIHSEYSFNTEQTHLHLYMTSVASQSGLVEKPIVKVSPEHGLEVKLSGSATTGTPPTTLSPALMTVNWRCKKASGVPYEVEITIPVENYEPIQFTLTKMCEYVQKEEGNDERGWAIFGIISCILIVFSMLFCAGGFVYQTRYKSQHGLHALPGMTYLSAFLEALSGGGYVYSQPEYQSGPSGNQVSWERPPVSAQGTTAGRYGSI